MNGFFKTMSLALALGISMASCSSDSDSNGSNDDDGPIAGVPANLVVTSVVAGTDATHPNGDGSGMVTLTATADNATSYTFSYPGAETVTSTNGVANLVLKNFGTNTYSIVVKAFAGTNSISKNIGVTVFYEPQMVWAEEFDTDGAPNPSFWTHELGNNNGWGNNESQSYTNSLDNSRVENGMLKITLKKEANGSFTSARLKSENKFEFTYGKIEFRAKLPVGGGTWPAIWMLGENYGSVAWPGCGEIDMMEHVGNQQNTIHATLHYPGNSGGNGNGNSISVANASTEFHIYTCEWTAQALKFYVDGTLYHNVSNSSSIPFNHDFFLILNVAMGGNFGGAIDPNFTESSLDIDYIRVYQ